MSEREPSTHINFNAMMLIEDDAPVWSLREKYIKMTAFADGPAYKGLKHLIIPEEVPYRVHFWNSLAQELLPEQAIIVLGSLIVEERSGDSPKLSLRAESIMSYVFNDK
jgi:hypothetical protein